MVIDPMRRILIGGFVVFCITLCINSAFADDGANFCHVPNSSNVSYSQVLEYQKRSPQHVLSYGEDALQFGELWLPNNNTELPVEKSPLVILIHGGCWLSEYDIKHTHALSSALADSGYAVWAVEYRRTGDKGGGWPGSFADINAAIDYASELSNFPVDTDHMTLIGHSAGGHLALLAGTKERPEVSAVIGLAAIVDIERYAAGSNSCQTATPRFIGGSPAERPGLYKDANPVGKKLHPKTILLHGTEDSIVPISQTETVDVQTEIISGAGHFDMVHPGTPAFQQLLKQLAKIYTP